MGIEPTSEAWEASILPLYDARSSSNSLIIHNWAIARTDWDSELSGGLRKQRSVLATPDRRFRVNSRLQGLFRGAFSVRSFRGSQSPTPPAN
jgi:hypothetical protein